MRHILVAAVLFVGLYGCGGKGDEGEGPKTIVKLEDVPAPAMKTAKEKLPGLNFHEAYLKKDGTYEVRGKDKNGKVREVEVKADGTFVQIE
jgi:uncharacterized membrane protein YkoI